MAFFRPAAGNITSYYGETAGRRIPHTGIDFGWGGGKTIYSAEAGTVLEARMTGPDFGNRIRLDHGPIETRYSHLAQFYVAHGDTVERGQKIGWMGNTGNAEFDHLHFEVYVDGRHVDPLPYLTDTAADNIRPLPEKEPEMEPWNIVDESTMKDGKHVDGSMCATVFPGGFFKYPRQFNTPPGKIEDAVVMSRKFGAHEIVSHAIFAGLEASFAQATIDEVSVPPVDVAAIARAVVDEQHRRLKE